MSLLRSNSELGLFGSVNSCGATATINSITLNSPTERSKQVATSLCFLLFSFIPLELSDEAAADAERGDVWISESWVRNSEKAQLSWFNTLFMNCCMDSSSWVSCSATCCWNTWKEASNCNTHQQNFPWKTKSIEDWKRVMNVTKHKKTLTLFLAFEFQRKKEIPYKLFEFLERFMIGAFLIKLTQLEKTGSTGKVLIRLEI